MLQDVKLGGGYKRAADPDLFRLKPAAGKSVGIFRPGDNSEWPLDQVLFQTAFIKVHLGRSLN
jgi:hypothetical protein